MEIKEIKNLIKLVSKSEVDELVIEKDGFKLKIKKNQITQLNSSVQQISPLVIPQQNILQPQPQQSDLSTESAKEDETKLKEEIDDYHYITSPIVGTFYRAPSPTSDPFVKEGDHVTKGQVLCIVEAMKVMNEVESDVSGTIVKILVENAEPVEYGDKLFAIKLD